MRCPLSSESTHQTEVRLSATKFLLTRACHTPRKYLFGDVAAVQMQGLDVLVSQFVESHKIIATLSRGEFNFCKKEVTIHG